MTGTNGNTRVSEPNDLLQIAMLPGWSASIASLTMSGAAEIIEILVDKYWTDEDASSVRAICSSLIEMSKDVC